METQSTPPRPHSHSTTQTAPQKAYGNDHGGTSTVTPTPKYNDSGTAKYPRRVSTSNSQTSKAPFQRTRPNIQTVHPAAFHSSAAHDQLSADLMAHQSLDDAVTFAAENYPPVPIPVTKTPSHGKDLSTFTQSCEEDGSYNAEMDPSLFKLSDTARPPFQVLTALPEVHENPQSQRVPKRGRSSPNLLDSQPTTGVLKDAKEPNAAPTQPGGIHHGPDCRLPPKKKVKDNSVSSFSTTVPTLDSKNADEVTNTHQQQGSNYNLQTEIDWFLSQLQQPPHRSNKDIGLHRTRPICSSKDIGLHRTRPIRSNKDIGLHRTTHFATRFMDAYVRILVKKPVKVLVVLAFTGLLGACISSAMQFEQEFDYTEVLPRDSYVTQFIDAAEAYREVDPIDIYVYFRFVNQSDPVIQEQMQTFVRQLTKSEYVEDKVGFFWLDHFRLFKRIQGYRLDGLTFSEQIDLFLEDETFGRAYRSDFERAKDGTILSSRVKLDLQVETDDVESQVGALRDIREITEAQPINRGKSAAEQAFFTYDGIYKLWEFFSIVNGELILTAIVGVVAVTAVAFLFIPHWSAACFVFPLVIILYVDLCGALQWAGVHLNAISYVSLTMSIGLLVDFVVHILFRFYEVPGNRTEKTIEMLRTMGASILLGGTTTFLGTLPLMFTASDVFRTVFWAFFGIVTIGMGHGLILLPVLLSTFGPETQIVLIKSKRKSQGNDAHDDTCSSNGSLSPPPSPVNQTSYSDYLVAGYLAAVNSFTKSERLEL